MTIIKRYKVGDRVARFGSTKVATVVVANTGDVVPDVLIVDYDGVEQIALAHNINIADEWQEYHNKWRLEKLQPNYKPSYQPGSRFNKGQ